MITKDDLIKRKGKISLDGKAFIDGRDFWSVPPLTVMKINSYKDQQRRKIHKVLLHGSEVKVIYYAKSNGDEFGMYLVEIENEKNRTCWVSELALTNSFPNTVGLLYKGMKLK